MEKNQIITSSIDKSTGAGLYQNNLLEAFTKMENIALTASEYAKVLKCFSQAAEQTETEIRCRESELLKKFGHTDSNL